jgi:hypothetical protein
MLYGAHYKMKICTCLVRLCICIFHVFIKSPSVSFFNQLKYLIDIVKLSRQAAQAEC